LPIGNLARFDLKVNAKTVICIDKIAQENLLVNDLLENMNILLNYIKKRRKNKVKSQPQNR